VLLLPDFTDSGDLPPGIHSASWSEFEKRFGATSHRQRLLGGLLAALRALRDAGCGTAYIDGSFVTAKEVPGDYDGCWDISGVDPIKLDPVLLSFDPGRAIQKAKYLGELFPAQTAEGGSGKTFLDFFQINKDSGEPKGLVAVDLRGLP